jgi:CheY-like chemotaxis protein
LFCAGAGVASFPGNHESGSVKSILVVEDEALIALMLEDMIESLGHRLHGVAANLAEGCAAAEAGNFDLAILDCNLMGEKVWPVAQILSDRNVPFVFSSGGDTLDIPACYAQRPMLEKPYTFGAIASILEQF